MTMKSPSDAKVEPTSARPAPSQGNLSLPGEFAMKSFDTSLLVLETAKLTNGLVAHETIAHESKDIRILEASVVGEGRFVILATGTVPELEAAAKAVRAKLDPEEGTLDQELIEKPSRSLFECALALTQQRIEESLVVIETETVSACFAIVQTLIDNHGLKPIELRIRRSGRGAHGYLTGSTAACGPAAEEARTRLRSAFRIGAVEWFEQPSAALRAQFDFV